MSDLATYSGWTLRLRDDRKRNHWLKFQVVSPDGVVYCGAFDGKRLGGDRGMAVLRRLHPTIHSWLLTELAKAAATSEPIGTSLVR
jgi:hypothetical protein